MFPFFKIYFFISDDEKNRYTNQLSEEFKDIVSSILQQYQKKNALFITLKRLGSSQRNEAISRRKRVEQIEILRGTNEREAFNSLPNFSPNFNLKKKSMWNDARMQQSLKFDDKIADILLRWMLVIGFDNRSKWKENGLCKSKTPRETPLYVVVSPNFSEFEKSLISKSLTSSLPLPHVLVEDAAKMALHARGKHTGVVLFLNSRIACISAFSEGKKILNEFSVIEKQGDLTQNSQVNEQKILESIQSSFFSTLGWNFPQKAVTALSSVKDQLLRKQLYENVHFCGKMMFQFREKFVEELNKLKADFFVKEECKEIICDAPVVGASTISGSSNIREQFGEFTLNVSLL